MFQSTDYLMAASPLVCVEFQINRVSEFFPFSTEQTGQLVASWDALGAGMHWLTASSEIGRFSFS